MRRFFFGLPDCSESVASAAGRVESLGRRSDRVLRRKCVGWGREVGTLV